MSHTFLRGKNATALHVGSGVCADNFPRLRLYMPSVGHPTQGAVRPARMRERPLGAREPVRILSREWKPLYLVERPTQQRQATPSSVQTLMLVILDDHARSWSNPGRSCATAQLLYLAKGKRQQ